MTATFVDADTHVIETEWTWDYLDKADEHFRPFAVLTSERDGRERAMWFTGGQMLKRQVKPKHQVYPPGAQMLTDIPARLEHMDRLGVDVQVLYPSFFLQSHIQRPELELALAKSYNRWLTEVCTASGGRLRWVAVPPLLDLAAGLTELEQAAKGGACGVYVRGTEHDRVLSDPYFFPLYEKASELNLPICVHVGNSLHTLNQVIEEESIIFDVVPVPAAMYSLLAGKIPERFPRLRFGFLESGASWVPFILQEAHRGPAIGGRAFSHHEGLVKDSRFYVACQTDDDLAYLLRYGLAGNLVFGTDYGHVDVGTDLEGHRLLLEREDLDRDMAAAIVDQNARALYAL